jgi:hypothetical protein
LDSKLSFREHIDSVVNKGSAISAMFGSIKRLSREFRDPYILKVLYVTYVRSKLEYSKVYKTYSQTISLERESRPATL